MGLRLFLIHILFVAATVGSDLWNPELLADASVDKVAVTGCLLDLLSDTSNRQRVYLERYLSPLEEIQSAIVESETLDQAINKLVQDDARKLGFRVEALFRLYSEKSGRRAKIRRWRGLVKELENNLGRYADAKKTAARAKELNAPDEVIKFLEKQELDRKNVLAEYLFDKGWAKRDNGEFNEMVQWLRKQEPPRQSEDRRYIIKRLLSEIEAIDETPYDMTDLQNGIHELRRKLRWLVIDIQAVRGKIQITDKSGKSPASLGPILAIDEASAVFPKIEGGEDVKKTITLSKPVTDALSILVGRFGAIKDSGERVEFFTDAYMGAAQAKGQPISRTQAEQSARKLLGVSERTPDFHAEARELYELFKASEILKLMRKELEEQL